MQIDRDIEKTTEITAIISNMIKDEWEAIDGYNQAIITLSVDGCDEDLIQTMNDILSEEYIHIGQLQKCLQDLIPEAENIDEGKVEAEEQEEPMQTLEEPTQEVATEEVEHAEWPDDDLNDDQVALVLFGKR